MSAILIAFVALSLFATLALVCACIVGGWADAARMEALKRKATK